MKVSVNFGKIVRIRTRGESPIPDGGRTPRDTDSVAVKLELTQHTLGADRFQFSTLWMDQPSPRDPRTPACFAYYTGEDAKKAKQLQDKVKEAQRKFDEAENELTGAKHALFNFSNNAEECSSADGIRSLDDLVSPIAK